MDTSVADVITRILKETSELEIDIHDGDYIKNADGKVELVCSNAPLKLLQPLPVDEICKHGITLDMISELYLNCGVTEGDFISAINPRGIYRPNAVHMFGVGHMRTVDVFDYFGSDVAPVKVEWVDNLCCNVVWDDIIKPLIWLIFHTTVGPSITFQSVGYKRQMSNVQHSSTFLHNRQTGLPESSVRPMTSFSPRLSKGHNETINKKDDFTLPTGLWRTGKQFHQGRPVYFRFCRINDIPSSQPIAQRTKRNTLSRRKSLASALRICADEVFDTSTRVKRTGSLSIKRDSSQRKRRSSFFSYLPTFKRKNEEEDSGATNTQNGTSKT